MYPRESFTIIFTIMIRELAVETVTLNVQDLDLVGSYYRDIIGLVERSRTDTRIELGTSDALFLRLDKATAPRRDSRAPGLYHTAFLLNSRQDLAKWLFGFAQLEPERQRGFTGAGDHGVSQALYMNDPEGNGVEIYYDRARDEWPRDEQGNISMYTDSVDLQALIGESGGQALGKFPVSAKIGHVHLKTSDLSKAQAWYVDRLGLDLIQKFGPAAMFVSVGGYHHQIGINTWESRGASPVQTGEPGLAGVRFRIMLQDESAEDYLARISEKLEDGLSQPIFNESGEIYAIDPSGIPITIAIQ